jgi:hypothetical protein
MERELSYYELRDSINKIKWFMSKDTINVNDTVISHFNNVLRGLNLLMDPVGDAYQEMLQMVLTRYMRQMVALYDEENTLTPEFIREFVIRKLDFTLRTSTYEFERNALANTIVMSRLEDTMDPEVLSYEDKIKAEIDVVVKDLINYNKESYDYRFSKSQGGQ